MNVSRRTLDPGTGPSMAAPAGAGGLRPSGLGFLILAPILLVTMLAALLPPDGHERANWMQFVGRFHPLLVHFPIALFLLVPILEIGGRNPRFSYLRLSVSLVLTLATLTAITAA